MKWSENPLLESVFSRREGRGEFPLFSHTPTLHSGESGSGEIERSCPLTWTLNVERWMWTLDVEGLPSQ